MSYKMIDAAQSPWLAVGATTPVQLLEAARATGRNRFPERRNGSRSARASSLGARSLSGAQILPVEHAILRWRVGTGQHAPQTARG